MTGERSSRRTRGGRPSPPAPGVRWTRAVWRRNGSSASAARAQWSGTVPRRRRRGDRAGHLVARLAGRAGGARYRPGSVNVQGYSPSKLACWVRKTGGIPEPLGQGPGRAHPLPAAQRPEVYGATAVLPGARRLPRPASDGLARASHDSITLHWVTDNWAIGAIAYDDSLIALAGLERSKLPTWSDWLRPRGPGARCGGRARPPARHTVIAGSGDLHTAAVGSGAVADFDAHVYIGTSSWVSCHVPFKKTDALTNIASIRRVSRAGISWRTSTRRAGRA